MNDKYNFFYITITIVAVCLTFSFIVNKPWFRKGKEDIMSNSKSFQPSVKFLLYFALAFLAFSLIAPWLFTRDSTKFPIQLAFNEKSGVIGDTVGGLMNPFVAIAGVIVTGLAFYIQYQANKQIQDQFKLQQMESQFYEMLKLHKENVNEMSIDGYQYDEKIDARTACEKYQKVKQQKNSDSYDHSKSDNIKETKITRGRKIFYLMLKEFHAAYSVVNKMIVENASVLKHDKELILNLSYHIFFAGKEMYVKHTKDKEKFYGLTTDTHNKIINELEVLRICHKEGVRYLENYHKQQSLHIDFSYKPFSGHLIRFAHFYRHMYAIANFIVNENNEILSYDDKRKYLKMFRAQLSNHEIALLYYNWLAGHGEAWEDKKPNDKRLKNRFFTDYRMIHNLDRTLLLEEFDPLELFNNSLYGHFLYKEGRKKSDDLFELYNIYSELSEEENQKLIRR